MLDLQDFFWFYFLFCREEEIRTLDTVTRIHTFQACSFNHSDTSLLGNVGAKIAFLAV